MTTASSLKTNIMLVDDSAVIRGALSRIIKADSSMDIVCSVANGEMAVSSAKNLQPDIVILDIEMPVMDGLEALPKILQESPKSKVIMFSSLTEKGASVTMKALSLGAVECLVKPSSAQDVGEGSAFQGDLLRLLKTLSPHKVPAPPASKDDKQPSVTAMPSGSYTLHKDPGAYRGKPSIIAIGSSTGGPNALFEMIKNFQGFDVPIVLTQHMPATFTKILASHIEQQAGIPAVEGEDGMLLQNGRVHVAPGGFHMLLKKDADQVKIELNEGPEENFCRPAVDPMMRSVIDIYGQKALGIILTGMGNDGLLGMRALIQKGGRLVAQDEETSVVWGMPGAVALDGICTEVLPIKEIGPWVRKAMMV